MKKKKIRWRLYCTVDRQTFLWDSIQFMKTYLKLIIKSSKKVNTIQTNTKYPALDFGFPRTTFTLIEIKNNHPNIKVFEQCIVQQTVLEKMYFRKTKSLS